MGNESLQVEDAAAQTGNGRTPRIAVTVNESEVDLENMMSVHIQNISHRLK